MSVVGSRASGAPGTDGTRSDSGPSAPAWLGSTGHSTSGLGSSAPEARNAPDIEAAGIAAVVNGLALCAIHHLAFDRDLLGIDPAGMIHIAGRLLREIDGPMLRAGLQGFHGASISMPRRPGDRPDPARLEARFERFTRVAA